MADGGGYYASDAAYDSMAESFDFSDLAYASYCEDESSDNEVGVAGPLIDAYASFKREEVVRIIAQALEELGLGSYARMLERESGVPLVPRLVQELDVAILSGQWADAVAKLKQLPLGDGERKDCVCLVRQHEFMELVNGYGNTESLEMFYKVMAKDVGRGMVQQLYFLYNKDKDKILGRAQMAPKRRGALITRLKRKFPPELALPPGRLGQLLKSAKNQQIRNRDTDIYPEPPKYSLMLDIPQKKNSAAVFDKLQVPGYDSEVTTAVYSPTGRLVAVGHESSTVRILDTCQKYREVKALRGAHDKKVIQMCWSSDDEVLLTVGRDNKLVFWKCKTGEVLRTIYQANAEFFGPCFLVPRGLTDYDAYLLYKSRIVKWTLSQEGQEETKYPQAIGMSVMPNWSRLLITQSNKRLVILDLENNLDHLISIHNIEVGSAISCSRDNRHVLVAKTDKNTIELMDLQTRFAVKSYEAPNEAKNFNKVIFGGAHEQFVMASSPETNNAYVWSRATEELIGQILNVGCIDYSPTSEEFLTHTFGSSTIVAWRKAPTNST
ncbi:hypothetical protein TRICI_000258 [Trichomonascus ciferrii]|uniref:LisH domain-containing protein n=1 Tax=Trichomonascus ciferrii TaxID=44093 RepID=A0A642VDU7_9ASCO|nr:hypothetical protein TRICI_000258 [Trichomonascus ciferrii]